MLARYQKDFYAGMPAVTENTYGKGKAYYLAAESTLDFLRAIYKRILKETGISCKFGENLPEGVTVNERITEKGESIFFLQNYNRNAIEITLEKSYMDLESGDVFRGMILLERFSCRVLTLEK